MSLTKSKLKKMLDDGLSKKQILEILKDEGIVTKRGAQINSGNLGYYLRSWGLSKRRSSRRKETPPIKIDRTSMTKFVTVARLLADEGFNPKQRASVAIEILKTV